MSDEIFNSFGQLKEIQVYVFVAILLISLKCIFYNSIQEEYAELKRFFPSCGAMKISSFSIATFASIFIGAGILCGFLTLPVLGYSIEENQILYYSLLLLSIVLVGLVVYWRYSVENIRKAFYE